MHTTVVITPARSFHGTPLVPGDKSISHRGLIFGALAEGETEILDILESGDVQSTAKCLSLMGVRIRKEGNRTWVEGRGRAGFDNPAGTLDCGNSGTTIRLLMGALAGQKVCVRMTGDASLTKRPMRRVAEPLRKMGARIELTGDSFAPLTVTGGSLRAIDYVLPVASAQIKSAIILAALHASGETRITGEIQSRDHTERLLSHFGVRLTTSPTEIRVPGGQTLRGSRVQVPADPSTAAFWAGAASLIPGSRLRLENILLNPTRIGFYRALERMGARITTQILAESPEPIGTLEVTHSALGGTTITREEVPHLIDELPLLAVLATQAQGRTEVSGAEELRVKESDRIESVAKGIRAMGGRIEVKPDGFVIEGPQCLRGASIETFLDHRIAMAFSIAGLVAEGETSIQGADCVDTSYPAFFPTLKEMTR